MRERLIPCPDNSEISTTCKYWPECHVSEHHIYPRRTMDTPLKKRFGNLAIHKVIVCRMIHDLLDTFPPPAYPDEELMEKKVARYGKNTFTD